MKKQTMKKQTMKKQKLVLGLSVILGCLSIAGCSGQTDDGNGDNTTAVLTSTAQESVVSEVESGSDESVELTIMGGAHLVSVAEVVLRDYLSQHPNIKINFEKYSFAEYPTKMKLQLSNNESTPDIMIIHDVYAPQLAKAGYLEDLSGLFAQEEVLPVMEPVSMDGKIYGLPNQVTNEYVFLYRKDVYDQLSMSPPKTFDEYYEQGLKLKDNGYYAGAFDPADPGCGEIFTNYLMMLGGEVLTPDGEVSLNKGVETLELIKKCVDAGIWHTSHQGSSEAYWTAFNAGKIAAFPSPGCHAAYYVTNVDPKGAGGYGKLAMARPMKFAVDGRDTFLINTEYYAINKNTKNLEAAKEIVKYLALTKEAAEKFSNVNEDGVMAQYATGYMEGIKAIAANKENGWEAYGGAPVVSDLAQLLLDTNPEVPYIDERNAEINTIISDVVGEMFLNGKYTPEEAVEVMKQRISDI